MRRRCRHSKRRSRGSKPCSRRRWPRVEGWGVAAAGDGRAARAPPPRPRDIAEETVSQLESDLLMDDYSDPSPPLLHDPPPPQPQPAAAAQTTRSDGGGGGGDGRSRTTSPPPAPPSSPPPVVPPSINGAESTNAKDAGSDGKAGAAAATAGDPKDRWRDDRRQLTGAREQKAASEARRASEAAAAAAARGLGGELGGWDHEEDGEEGGGSAGRAATSTGNTPRGGSASPRAVASSAGAPTPGPSARGVALSMERSHRVHSSHAVPVPSPMQRTPTTATCDGPDVYSAAGGIRPRCADAALGGAGGAGTAAAAATKAASSHACDGIAMPPFLSGVPYPRPRETAMERHERMAAFIEECTLLLKAASGQLAGSTADNDDDADGGSGGIERARKKLSAAAAEALTMEVEALRSKYMIDARPPMPPHLASGDRSTCVVDFSPRWQGYRGSGARRRRRTAARRRRRRRRLRGKHVGSRGVATRGGGREDRSSAARRRLALAPRSRSRGLSAALALATAPAAAAAAAAVWGPSRRGRRVPSSRATRRRRRAFTRSRRGRSTASTGPRSSCTSCATAVARGGGA